MKQSYLHPVITPNGNATNIPLPPDNSVLKIKQIKTDDYIVTIDLNLNDEYVLSLVNEGLADYLFIVECSSTRYRKSYTKNVPHIDIAIPRKSVVDSVKILPYVVVRSTLDYKNPNAIKLYDDCVFELSKGDVLVEFQGHKFNAEITYAIDNIFKVVCNPDPEVKFVEYSLEDKIRIILPNHDFSIFRDIREDHTFDTTIQASLVINALLYALFCGDFDKEEKDSDENWKKTIRAAVEGNTMQKKYNLADKDSYPEIAQALLDNVFSTLFSDLTKRDPIYETETI